VRLSRRSAEYGLDWKDSAQDGAHDAVTRQEILNRGWLEAIPRRRTQQNLEGNSAIQKSSEPAFEAANVNLAFPHNKDAPPCPAQTSNITPIPLHISLQFGIPIAFVRGGTITPCPAGMAVPETAVNEDNLAAARKHQIRRARQITGVQPVSKPHPVHQAADSQFRPAVFTADPSHQGTAFGLRQFVHQGSAGCRRILPKSMVVSQIFFPCNAAAFRVILSLLLDAQLVCFHMLVDSKLASWLL
jgi:hypothetical protein